MKNLKAKLRKNGGFTLIEMLIVVAIIAILIAVSIPLVANALERAKHATDAANERAAKAEIVLQFLADDNAVVDGAVVATGIVADTVYYYDAVDGGLASAADKLTGAKATYGQHNGHKYLALCIDANGQVGMGWVDATTATYANAAAVKAATNLCSTATAVSH